MPYPAFYLNGWEALLIFMIGFLALLVEILVIPGFGLVGLAGILFMLFALYLALHAPGAVLAALALAILVAAVVLYWAWRRMEEKRLLNQLILTDNQESKAGYLAPDPSWQKLVGKSGLTLTPLRPAGKVEIAGQVVDVVSEGEYLPGGVKVTVIKVEGQRIVVRKEKPGP
ncbi:MULTISPECIES: NfeD family protein [Carboxydocella]|uniref:NfeD-like C-terminal, partner-binding n=2 Tax=Carboxydocella TaxID=178898 RepID=A0A1T4NFE2_9FIRM|nr:MULTISPECIES: NfeD family protein [Carboxydocella]AVX20019.1 NfeD-like domain containing protein [Carboxydocella thermautotrophica]AVX30435.1 NfeD-like domain containing protein [Carboxydocella thermautotrophica]SJZ77989.1 NfeD-like C-terminal, partner-binding [Carboxydocella sporoproducens DSM 16521]GAW30196.1 NfeD-like C-terminal, partner-binding [Carboxydocella sp. ULO1]GAW32329.1 NfeD-like C-terminal, partner-binding [Carboxydocella sp. JDF658]